MLSALVRDDGSAAHRWFRSPALTSGRHAARNLSDAIHYLCLLHGTQPALIDQVPAHAVHPAAAEWLTAAVAGFAIERNNLANLAVAAGPMPSTPGQAECEAAINGQRHALATLAESGRVGCAIGAAAALLLDWAAIRILLDDAAERLGVPPLPATLPGVDATLAVIDAAAETPIITRAMTFGARQILGQQRGLWDLLEARRDARDRG
ncbi:DUF6975 family protein [Sphingomonas sanxanigenens]|nr:hypothetical protein [Sphingomonas sanxanigenens]